MEWDYGAYEGQTTAQICGERPGWTLWNDGVVDGERAADVGRRVDRVIERARQVDGDTLCVAHGHVLRVLTARWLGLPPVAGRLFVCPAVHPGVGARPGDPEAGTAERRASADRPVEAVGAGRDGR